MMVAPLVESSVDLLALLMADHSVYSLDTKSARSKVCC